MKAHRLVTGFANSMQCSVHHNQHLPQAYTYSVHASLRALDAQFVRQIELRTHLKVNMNFVSIYLIMLVCKDVKQFFAILMSKSNTHTHTELDPI